MMGQKQIDPGAHYRNQLRRGWDVFAVWCSSKTRDGTLEIQKVDDSDRFKSDEEAVRHVVLSAMAGSTPCVEALAATLDQDDLANQILWELTS